MSVRRLSPTANLLRTSRLFSLPPPLSRPDLSVVSSFGSETATTPYPTHAAIETTQSSLARGDWGLKRPLPLKSTTKTSTPVIHIDNIDSIDHITDFDSAADHALTLRKWQELDISLSKAEQRNTASGALPPEKSVFDSQFDNTELSGSSPGGPSKERWKFKGPWLAGKTDGEFNDYVKKKVKRRKLDFKRYLGEHLTQSKLAAQRREAIEKGEDVENLAANDVPVSEEEIETYMRYLRNNQQDLHKLVEEYLDLPREEGRSLGSTTSQYNEIGPPTTHPSAGLSYLHTASHIYNHPELGPQEHKAPVQGRIITPQKTGKNRKHPQALIGVAGVVGRDNQKTFFQKHALPGISSYDPDIPGGGKLWTQPRRASIDSFGRIELQVERADKNATDIAMGKYSDEEPKLPPAAFAGSQNRDVPDLAPSRPKDQRENLGDGKGSGRATPFLGANDKAPDLHELLLSSL